jgi:glucans biosynthesis protein
MPTRMRPLALIAMLALAALLLTLDQAPDPAAGAQAPAPAPATATRAAASPGRSAPARGSPQPSHAFGFADVRQMAQERGRHEYQPMAETLPAALANLTYDQYRDIRFRPASALWHGQAMFEVQFFHRGYRNRQRVNIFEVTAAGASPVVYNPQYFTFGKLVKPPKSDAGLGYAGLRVHYPLQSSAYKDELIAFLGASYFRVLGRNQHYGLSARGLAIDTAAPSGEEFPTFTDFWLVRPQATDRTLTIYALLDSKSISGAYQFQIRPGIVTQVEVRSELFPRHAIGKLGVAPLTSMFLYDEDGNGHRFDDFRPQVHDSDGFMTETGHGQWIWRPLGNPRELRVNRFMDDGPGGFGLIQRERDFAQYQDNEAQYQSRPSYWVQPLGNWGSGGVELVEIPSDEEIHDNIVAYWVPAHAPAAGQSVSFAYLLTAFAEAPQWPPGGRVIATRTGNPSVGDNKGRFGPGARRVVVEFAGGDLNGLEAAQPVRAEVTADNAKIDALTVQRLPGINSWQVAFVVTPRAAKKPVDMKCFLSLYGEVLSETWVYQWTP